MRFILLFLLFPAALLAQSQDEVLAQGWLLYKSEKASWHGTDIFMERFPKKKTSIGGYISYTEGNVSKCIFYDQEEKPNVLAAITFDDKFKIDEAKVDTSSRKLTMLESELSELRNKAASHIETDTIFKHYENTGYNLIPLIVKKKKMVYVLTGPKVNGVVIFGNDYLIEFDSKNNIKSAKQLHANIIPIEMGDENAESTIHSHTDKTGHLITATDICTLLLYAPYTHWKSHTVISSKNVSVWDVSKKELLVLTREAWEKISKDAAKD
jgi:hypothetical protein